MPRQSLGLCIYIGGGVIEKMSGQDIARLQENIKTLFGDFEELKSDVKEIKAQLANRLPLWATVLISVLTAAIGWLLAGGGM